MCYDDNTMEGFLMSMSSTCQAVLNLIAQKEPCAMSYEEISSLSACSYTSVRRAVKKLSNDGWLVVSVRRGAKARSEYALSERARNILLMQRVFTQ